LFNWLVLHEPRRRFYLVVAQALLVYELYSASTISDADSTTSTPCITGIPEKPISMWHLPRTKYQTPLLHLACCSGPDHLRPVLETLAVNLGIAADASSPRGLILALYVSFCIDTVDGRRVDHHFHTISMSRDGSAAVSIYLYLPCMTTGAATSAFDYKPHFISALP
jgi:hypothetical protein